MSRGSSWPPVTYWSIPAKLASGNAGDAVELDTHPNSHVLVVPLSGKKNLATSFTVKVFCECRRKTYVYNQNVNTPHGAVGNSQIAFDGQTVAQVYEKRIDVPKFSMFVFDDRPAKQANNLERENNIRLSWQLRNSSKVFQVRSRRMSEAGV